MLNPLSEDPVTQLNGKLSFLMHLKSIGEEPYEIEYLVREVAEMLSAGFVVWLKKNKHDLPDVAGELVATGLTNYLFFRPGRRAVSPLLCGASVQAKFVSEAVKEMKLPKGSEVFLRAGLRLFAEYRKTLVPAVH